MNATGPWISVKERLPDPGVLILIWHGHRPKWPVVGHHGRDGCWWSDNANVICDVTHWAEIQPPEGE
ncbi:MAG: DUF551 domain-containing protein [Patescibacteria group bacterium]|nr:DUF551 domain-containing protein [Patescibacteria group bacterium]